MKKIKVLAFALSILLSVSMISVGFAQEGETSEAVMETEVNVAAPVVEMTQEPQIEEPAQQPTVAPVLPQDEQQADADAQPEDTAENVAEQVETTPEATPETTPETTPEAIPETTPEATAEPTEVPVETEIPAARNVIIRMDVPDNLQFGDTITLSAELIGYGDVQVSLQWQYTKDGETWMDATGTGSDALVYSFQVDEETAGTSWRLAVTIL